MKSKSKTTHSPVVPNLVRVFLRLGGFILRGLGSMQAGGWGVAVPHPPKLETSKCI